MQLGQHRCKYIKHYNGRGRFGIVDIEITVSNTGNSVIKSRCQWQQIRADFPNFKETNFHKSILKNIICAAESIFNKYTMPMPIVLTIKDIFFLPIDTSPLHLGAAIIIGIFDRIESPLNALDLKTIDDFITDNEHLEFLANYKTLILTKRINESI